MAKTKEELIALKQEYESLNSKLNELSDDELKQVTGGLTDLEYQYVFSFADIVYILPEQRAHYIIMENVQTNSRDTKVKCKKRYQGDRPRPILDDESEYVSVGDLMRFYDHNGGIIKSLK